MREYVLLLRRLRVRQDVEMKGAVAKVRDAGRCWPMEVGTK